MVRFLKKGIKDGEGKYFPVWYSHSENYGSFGKGREVIVIYAKTYERFSDEIQKAFMVRNDTDHMTDYFDKDKITIEKHDPMFKQLLPLAG